MVLEQCHKVYKNKEDLMFNMLNNKKAQSTLEYAILIIIIIGALLAVQTYIKRGIQGKLKSSSDDIGDQYSPDNTKIEKVVTSHSNTAESYGVTGQGASSTVIIGNEQNFTKETAQIINTSREKW